MSEGTDLVDVEFVKERAGGIGVGGDHVLRGVENGLPGTSHRVFAGHNDETPRGHMPEEILGLLGRAKAAISPGEDRVQETIRAQVAGIEENALMALRIARSRTLAGRDGPRPWRIVVKFDRAGRVV